MDKKVVLLLTGTINPNNMVFTKLQDPEIRKNEYIDSIKFWLKTANIPIVFIENSNTDLSSYFQNEIKSNLLEVIFFNGNEYKRELGKGYGELSCLEHAYTNSKFIKASTFVFKVTGRYKVNNFLSFYDNYFKDTEVNLSIDFKWNLSFCDSRFFGFSPSFIPGFLLAYKDLVNDGKGVFFEHILSKAALTAIANGYIYKPLITLPRIEGYSGSSGAKYNSNYFHWLRYKFKYELKYKSFGLGNLPWI